MCVWQSMSPGMIVASPRSLTVAPSAASPSRIETIRSPLMTSRPGSRIATPSKQRAALSTRTLAARARHGTSIAVPAAASPARNARRPSKARASSNTVRENGACGQRQWTFIMWRLLRFGLPWLTDSVLLLRHKLRELLQLVRRGGAVQLLFAQNGDQLVDLRTGQRDRRRLNRRGRGAARVPRWIEYELPPNLGRRTLRPLHEIALAISRVTERAAIRIVSRHRRRRNSSCEAAALRKVARRRDRVVVQHRVAHDLRTLNRRGARWTGVP